MKKIATIAGAAILFASALVPALANGNDCVNSTTGPLSSNTCTILNSSSVKVKNVNDAKVVNNVTARSNSGGNNASMNTLGGSIVSGDASLETTVSTVANINTTNVTGGPSVSGNAGRNSITGPESSNVIWVENKHRVNVYNSNTATIDNNVNVEANSGDNNASSNTGPASIATGNASLGLMVGNHANDSLTEVEIGSGGTGGNSAENATTGPFSTNSVSLLNNNNVVVNGVNDMIVGNRVGVLARSGANRASANTLGADITTGGAAAGASVDTEGNFNTTRITMAMGGFSNSGTNSITGPVGSSSIWVENNQSTVVDNWNNKCRSHNAGRLGKRGCLVDDLGVFNNVDVISDAGSNLANSNTGAGNVIAGLADLMQQVLVHMNDSLTEINQ